MKTRYAVTHINRENMRTLSYANQGRNHCDTVQEAQAKCDARLRLFSLYVDFEAAICARWAIGTITKRVGLHWRTSSEIWALDFFETDQPLRQMVLQGAANADVLIVALSSGNVVWLPSLS